MFIDRLKIHWRSLFRLEHNGFGTARRVASSSLTALSMNVILPAVALLGGISGVHAQQPVWDGPVQNNAVAGYPVVEHAEPSQIQSQQSAAAASPYPNTQPTVIPILRPEPPAASISPPIEALPSVQSLPTVTNDLPAIQPTATESCWSINGLARGYYRNDQRIQWSGMEETFGAEGVIAPVFRRQLGNWETTVEGEFYLNQPFDRNILADTPTRVSYMGNYDVDVFEISQLSITCRRDDFSIKAGKMVTPFGRTYFPLYSNARIDAPFIRTEAILWRETGFLIHYQPGIFVGDAAITNGSENLDSNSSKAIVARLGLQTEFSALGCSVKWQDGIGSEEQKQFNNHVGADAMVRCGPFQLSGECIYDEYGFYHPFDPNDITWRHSIYYRELNRAVHVPLTGVGYYADLGYKGQDWDVNLNYGGYYPTEIGNPQHDVPNRRGIIKLAYRFTPALQTYCAALMETSGMIAQEDLNRRGHLLLSGLQYVF
jgi:hypothetical protein